MYICSLDLSIYPYVHYSPPPPAPRNPKFVCLVFLHLWLHFCFVNKFICTCPRLSFLKIPHISDESESRSVVSDPLRPQGLYSPWNSPGQNTGVGSLSLLQGSSQPRDWTQVPCIAGRFFTVWATRDATHKWYYVLFVFLCLTYFTQCNSLGPSVLLQMALFFTYCYFFIPL